MAQGLDSFSTDQFDQAFFEVLKSILADPLLESMDEPKAILLGGQSGSGKTTLHYLMKKALNGNALIINGDEYRRSHPNSKQIQETFGVDAPAHTAKWSGKMTEALIDALSSQGFNLVIEGTLRTSDVPLRTAKLLRSRGYAVSLAIMAVKPEVSLVSCQIRYEMMRLAGTVPRATDPVYHNKIVHDIANNLAVLEESDLFDSVEIFDRAGRKLYPSVGVNGPASEVLRNKLFGAWTQEEREHLEMLQSKLNNYVYEA